jgi:(R,R)-butanediol dehydrogenase / meso-butanediol dehydrogenase / diacetyl reductase
MPDIMKAATWAGTDQVEITTRPIPEPAPGQARIKVEAVGVCGTDIAIYKGKHPRAKAPLIMGHEVGGVVDTINGDAPADVAPGTRVTFFPLITCGVCRTCLSGKTYVCENLKLIGIDTDGGMAEYMIVPTEALVPVPESWSGEMAALMEPVAVALHSVKRSSIKLGDTVLITGAGIIGILCGQMAKAAGALHVVIADLVESRLEIAAGAGLIPANLKNDGELDRIITDLTGGAGVDVTMECSGAAGAQPLTTKHTRVLGEVLLVGMPKDPPPVDIRMVTFKELSMAGTRVYERIDFERSIELLDQKRITAAGLVSHRFTVEQTKEAIDTMAVGGDSMKIMITF